MFSPQNCPWGLVTPAFPLPCAPGQLLVCFLLLFIICISGAFIQVVRELLPPFPPSSPFCLCFGLALVVQHHYLRFTQAVASAVCLCSPG